MRTHPLAWLFMLSVACVDGAKDTTPPDDTTETETDTLGDTEPQPADPTTEDAAGPAPSELLQSLRDRPIAPLNGAADVPAFVDFASGSMPDEREAVRATLAAAAADDAVIQELIRVTEDAIRTDFSRALICLSLLGEARSERGAAFLWEFVQRQIPVGEEVLDGGDPVRHGFLQLQAKAVSGLAYMRTEQHDAEVLRMVTGHEDIVVRAEAIRAFRYNQPDLTERLLAAVNQGELAYVYRVQRDPTDGAEQFNAKLATFLSDFPELAAPAPARVEVPREGDATGSGFDEPAPRF
jgi:hypothetical protein